MVLEDLSIPQYCPVSGSSKSPLSLTLLNCSMDWESSHTSLESGSNNTLIIFSCTSFSNVRVTHLQAVEDWIRDMDKIELLLSLKFRIQVIYLFWMESHCCIKENIYNFRYCLGASIVAGQYNSNCGQGGAIYQSSVSTVSWVARNITVFKGSKGVKMILNCVIWIPAE